MLARCTYRNKHCALDCRRSVSNALHFYSNKQLELYAAKEAKRLTLRQLVRRSRTCGLLRLNCTSQVFFGRSMNEERLITVRHLLIYGICWNSYLPCAERELCQDRAPSSYSAQVAGYASVAIRCSNAGGHGQGLRGVFLNAVIQWPVLISPQLYWSAFDKFVIHYLSQAQHFF